MNKVLVCITIQENSKRLMQKGSELAAEVGGELHILHIRKGNSIFDTPNSSGLFESLFVFGSELGGQVHFLCSEDVPKTINDFIKDTHITHLVIGQHTDQLAASCNVSAELTQLQDAVDIVTIKRNN